TAPAPMTLSRSGPLTAATASVVCQDQQEVVATFDPRHAVFRVNNFLLILSKVTATPAEDQRDSGCLGGRRLLQAKSLDGGLAHLELLDLARDRHREVVDEHDVAWDLVVGQLAPAEVFDVLFGGDLAFTQPHPCAQL